MFVFLPLYAMCSVVRLLVHSTFVVNKHPVRLGLRYARHWKITLNLMRAKYKALLKKVI